MCPPAPQHQAVFASSPLLSSSPHPQSSRISDPVYVVGMILSWDATLPTPPRRGPVEYI